MTMIDDDFSYWDEMAEAHMGSTLDVTQKSLANDIISDNSQSQLAQDPRNAIDQLALKNLFFSEDWVFIVCDRIASKISSQWVRVMREELVDGKKMVSPAEGHSVQKLLENPNSDQDYHSWMYSLVVDDCLMGNSFIWRAKKENQLLLLPSEGTVVEQGADGGVKSYRVYYTQEMARRVLKFDPTEVCHIRRPNPSSRIFGLSPFIPGRKSVLFNRFTSEYLNNFYLKGAQPGLLLEMVDVANEKNAIRLLRSFENAYTGRANQRKTMILPKGVSAQTISQSLADQQLIEYVNANRETIMNLLQIPKHELGLAESGSLGSQEYKTALKNFWSGQLRSIMRRIAGSLTKFFADELGEGYFIEFDLSDVDVLQEDQDQKAQLAEKLLHTHTLNEVRAKLYDLDPLESGDTAPGVGGVNLPAAANAPADATVTGDPTVAADALENQVTSPQQALNGAQVSSLMEIVAAYSRGEITRESAINIISIAFALSPEDAAKVIGDNEVKPPPPVDQGNPIKLDDTAIHSELIATNADNLRAIVKAGDVVSRNSRRIDSKAEEIAPEFAKSVMKVFADQADGVVRAVIGEKKADDLPSKKELRRRIIAAMDDLEDQYLEGYADVLTSMVDIGYDSTLGVQLGGDDVRALEAIRLRNSNKRRATLEARGVRSFKFIAKKSTDDVMQVIEDGIANSLSIQDIARNIAEFYKDGDAMFNRAMTIARTEVMTASALGQAAALSDSEKILGPMIKVWLTMEDDLVRGDPSGKYPNSKGNHWKLAGEVRFTDEPFGNDLMFPSDPNANKPEEVINCRCKMIALAVDDAESMGFKIPKRGG